MSIKVSYLNPNCKLIKGSSGALAFDVKANISEPITLKIGETVKIPLGFKIDTGDENVGMFLFMRSGLATNHGLMLMNSVGVIDSDYRGECIAAIWNTGSTKQDFIIKPFDRIAQVMFINAVNTELIEVNTLEPTNRGNSGFGSTGII